MKKEFIPYELALELKQLRFDEPCFGSYVKLTETQITFFMNDVVSEIDRETPLHKSLITKAPLYQQAFRWFREKYNIDSFVKREYENAKVVGYYFGIDTLNHFDFIDFRSKLYKTYEEAELACLKKLTELVKSPQG
jgi:hypothetical protein